MESKSVEIIYGQSHIYSTDLFQLLTMIVCSGMSTSLQWRQCLPSHLNFTPRESVQWHCFTSPTTQTQHLISAPLSPSLCRIIISMWVKLSYLVDDEIQSWSFNTNLLDLFDIEICIELPLSIAFQLRRECEIKVKPLDPNCPTYWNDKTELHSL